ncbi:MAG TPA: arsenite methyltransferase [Myxococcales bacterium]
MNKQAEEIRSDVSKAYGEAVSKPAKAGCCGSEPAQKGVAVKLGGYSSEELAALPEEAVVNSFGCGNPVALAGLREGDTVLDLGSGAGIDLLLAAKKVGPSGRVIGIDMTDEMIAKANANIQAGHFTNVEVRKGIIEQMPVESGSVDWVVSNCVINLSPEKPKVFREIAQVLKPGGRMLVSDIVAKDLPKEIREVGDLYASCIGGAISEEEYLAGLRAAGLVDAEVRDRLVYDADQLAAIASSDIDSLCKCADGKKLLAAAARTIAGKVWSAKIYARKPA